MGDQKTLINKNPKIKVAAAVAAVSLIAIGGTTLAYYKNTHKLAVKPKQTLAENKTESKSDKKVDAPANTSTTPTQPQNTSQPAANTVTPVSQPKSLAASTYTAPKTITTTPTPAPAPAPVWNGIYSTADAQDYIEGRIVSLVNAERARVGKGSLTAVSQLNQAADIRVGEEAIPSFSGTDHTRPNGTSFDTVFPQVGYTGCSAWGENLVYGYQNNFTYNSANLNTLAQQMFDWWKNSPGHYTNMISGNYNQTGVGVKFVISGGRLYWFGIQDFARR